MRIGHRAVAIGRRAPVGSLSREIAPAFDKDVMAVRTGSPYRVDYLVELNKMRFLDFRIRFLKVIW